MTAVVLLAIGLAGLFWANNRRFKRRNAAGVEEFSSYGASLATGLFEMLLRIGSILLILMGGSRILLAALV